MVIRLNNNIQRFSNFFDGLIRYSFPYVFIAEVNFIQTESICYTEVFNYSEWRTVMDVNFDVFLRNGIWNLVLSNLNINVIGCNWVYRINRRVDGTVERYNVRLVVNGFY